MQAALLKAQIERTLPAAFTVYRREHRGSISTGIPAIDDMVQGIPLHALSEICGGGGQGSPDRPLLPFWFGSLASSGKTSVFASLLAQATRDHFCALVDATDNFDPASAQASGVVLSRLLWVRCGKTRGPQTARFWRAGVETGMGLSGLETGIKLPRLEQAFKVADILLQSNGFRLIAVDLSGIPERVVRKVPLSTWFRFSRVIERQPAALVFIAQQPHATSCAGLVLRIKSELPVLAGNLFTEPNLDFEIVRSFGKKPARSEGKVSKPNISFAPKATEAPRLEEEMSIKKILPGFSPCRSGVEGGLRAGFAVQCAGRAVRIEALG